MNRPWVDRRPHRQYEILPAGIYKGIPAEPRAVMIVQFIGRSGAEIFRYLGYENLTCEINMAAWKALRSGGHHVNTERYEW